MIAAVDSRSSRWARTAQWIGRSGRSYHLAAENLDSFTMEEDSLFLLARGSHVLWVGSSGELVADPLSRSRFRLAMSCADRIFSLVALDDAAQRLATIWDLEGAAPQVERSAA